MMDKTEIIRRTEQFVKNKLEGEGSGHDWWHIVRVKNIADQITKNESDADPFIVQIAALLQDIADWKFHDGDDTIGPKAAMNWLESQGVEGKTISKVAIIIQEISFKGAGVKSNVSSKEGMIVQDADRLDAIGAVGIARTFAFGGHKNREIYNPDIKPEFHQSFEEYKKNCSPTINHFYEKLLLLRNLMNTETAKKMAEGRHRYMEEYLLRFYEEWEGKK